MLAAETQTEGPANATLQIARLYIPFLTSSSYEKICQEPASLENELHFIGHEMEQLAAQNVPSFLENARLVQHISDHDFPDILKTYQELSDMYLPLVENLESIQTTQDALSKQRDAYRSVL